MADVIITQNSAIEEAVAAALRPLPMEALGSTPGKLAAASVEWSGWGSPGERDGGRKPALVFAREVAIFL